MGTITTAMCDTFKQELLGGTHDLDSHDLKLALIKESPTDNYGVGTKSYNNAAHTSAGESLTQGNNDEATGTNYTAGGQVLDGATIALDTTNNVAYLDFTDEVFSDLTISADGAILYNSSVSGNPAIAVFNFGATVTSTSGDFTVKFPDAAHNTAVIRIS